MIQEIVIPVQRIPAVLGRDGKTKREIEKLTKTKITVREYIMIEGESLEALKAKEIVAAIGRGFSPEHAFHLVSDNYELYVISLQGENENTRKRLFARVIGREGKAKKNIEERTGSFISVYGKTVSIIAPAEGMDAARKAVEALLQGRTHGFAYKRLEKKKERGES